MPPFRGRAVCGARLQTKRPTVQTEISTTKSRTRLQHRTPHVRTTAAVLPSTHHTQTPRTRKMRTTPLHATMGRRRAARLPPMATTRPRLPTRAHLAGVPRGSMHLRSRTTL